jgi:hypothetical protein
VRTIDPEHEERQSRTWAVAGSIFEFIPAETLRTPLAVGIRAAGRVNDISLQLLPVLTHGLVTEAAAAASAADVLANVIAHVLEAVVHAVANVRP